MSSTRDRIENAALDAFAELGFHATSMRLLAKQADVQAGTLYHWFPNKEALLVSIMRNFLDGLNRELMVSIEAFSSPADRLAAALRTHVTYHGLHRRAAFVTDTEVRALTGESREMILAIRDDYERLFNQMIRDGIDAGLLSCSEPRTATRAILLACTGVALWYRPNGPLSLSEVADIHVELVMKALAREPQDTRRELRRG